MKHLKISILLLTFMGLAIQCAEDSGCKDKSEEINPGRESENSPHLLSPEEIQHIQEQLNNEDSTLEPVKLSSWERFKGIQFPNEGVLTWSTSRVLEIQTAGDIIFPAGFSIQYIGTGGGLILKSYFNKSHCECIKGTIKFENVNPLQVDFSQSTNGAISLFYEPIPPLNPDYNSNHLHKYNNPTDFSKNIKLRESDTYFCSFMLVNNSDDLQRITCNPTGNYALCNDIGIDTGHQNSSYSYSSNYGKKNRLSGSFNGIFNYNGYSFSQKNGWNWGKTIDELIFENVLSPDSLWGDHLLFMAPPFQGTYKQLLNLILQEDDEEEAAVALVGGAGRQKLSEKELVYIDGIHCQTPLHLAARCGRTKIVEAICRSITQNMPENGYITMGLGVSTPPAAVSATHDVK